MSIIAGLYYVWRRAGVRGLGLVSGLVGHRQVGGGVALSASPLVHLDFLIDVRIPV